MQRRISFTEISELKEDDLFTFELNDKKSDSYVFVGKIYGAYVARPFQCYKAIEFKGEEEVFLIGKLQHHGNKYELN